MAIARPSYTLRLSTHGVTGADGGKKKYLYQNISHYEQKVSDYNRHTRSFNKVTAYLFNNPNTPDMVWVTMGNGKVVHFRYCKMIYS